MGHKNGDGALETGFCHRMGGNQLFRLSEANQLAQYDQCVTIQQGIVTVVHCDTTQYREWNHDQVSTALIAFELSELNIKAESPHLVCCSLRFDADQLIDVATADVIARLQVSSHVTIRMNIGTRKAELLNSLNMKITANENNINDILQTFR